ncbi:helix-turn-helix domain-containing protein [Thermococcus gorgonarius]|uniref:DNA-binding protein n=1 Tax=Thermococcus gorgonarius TaxID=71997 RepID=A0A2Z2MAU9_THEGO|nr:helix-turn-helix domain-containing protein [Thermococcus gorgonarius]ASJ01054.1 DNA-binding protein [Thermococcus gorgonarius]
MGKLEKVLELIKEGTTREDEIAEKLGIEQEEVAGMIKILESLGYVERIEYGSKACETCPLKKICGGSCLRPTGVEAFKLTDKAFSLKK